MNDQVFRSGVLSLLCFSYSLASFGQNATIDILNKDIQSMQASSSSGSSDSLEKQLNLRHQLQQILDDSIKVLGDIDYSLSSTQTTHRLLDSIIATHHFEATSVQDVSDIDEHMLNIIYSLRVKEYLEQSSPEGDAAKQKTQKKNNWLSLRHDNEVAIQHIEDQLTLLEERAFNEAPRKKQPPSTPIKKPDSVFDTKSIVDQIINASIESGQSYNNQLNNNKNFEDRKAFMAWPLEEGELQSRFNTSRPYIQIKSSESLAKSVHQGEVIYSKKLGGQTYTVVVMHDSGYYSVYSNLEKSLVLRGQKLSYQEIIGYAKSDSPNNYRLNFEIQHQSKSIDPLYWLKNG